MTTEETPVIPKAPQKSKGQLYKETHGISKTMKNLLLKHSVNTVDEYKVVRKARKKRQNELAKAKRDRVKAGKKSKDTKLKKPD